MKNRDCVSLAGTNCFIVFYMTAMLSKCSLWLLLHWCYCVPDLSNLVCLDNYHGY